MPPPAITTWNRVEPRPSTNDFVSSLRAEIRDPVWLLTRQRQMGEFQGEDTGSPAYVRLTTTTATAVTKWLHTPAGSSTPVELDFAPDGGPLEAQVLAEPFTPDLATRAELGQTFLDLIAGAVNDPGPAGRIRTSFTNAAKTGGLYALAKPAPKEFDPLDRDTEQFFAVVGGRVPDGFKILNEKTVPTDVSDIAGDVNKVFTAFATWVKSVFGVGFSPGDPKAWNAERLAYEVSVKAGDNAGATLSASPDEDGAFAWPSFDLTVAGDPFVGGDTRAGTVVPAHVRFPGMPAPRFWDFEDGSVPLADVETKRSELAKLMLVDVALVHGIDWFVIPFVQGVGRIARIDSLVVHDVFGHRTLVERAETGNTAPGPGRWTIFSIAQAGALAGFTMVPPAAAQFRQAGPTLEEIRFARDEMANMVWGIERVTEGHLGEPRSGSARDAAVEAASPSAEAVTSTAPLKYQIESMVRVDWIPFLALPSDKRAAPAQDLEKAAVVRPKGTAIAGVPALGKVLNPAAAGSSPYRIPEEEMPRSGLTIQRVVYRSRWTDGRAFLWVSRRRITGTGETQSGLRFDAALPTRSAT